MRNTTDYFIPGDEKQKCESLNFKDFAYDDLNTFFNVEEFADAEKVVIAGKKVTVVFDAELLKEYNSSFDASLNGEISQGEFSFFVAINDCKEDTVFEGAVVMYQNRRYEMIDVREDEGVYHVVLGASV